MKRILVSFIKEIYYFVKVILVVFPRKIMRKIKKIFRSEKKARYWDDYETWLEIVIATDPEFACSLFPRKYECLIRTCHEILKERYNIK